MLHARVYAWQCADRPLRDRSRAVPALSQRAQCGPQRLVDGGCNVALIEQRHRVQRGLETNRRRRVALHLTRDVDNAGQETAICCQVLAQHIDHVTIQHEAAYTARLDQRAEPQIGLHADIDVREQLLPQPPQQWWVHAHSETREPCQLECLRLLISEPRKALHRLLRSGTHLRRRRDSRMARRISPTVVRSLQCSRIIDRESTGGQRSAS